MAEPATNGSDAAPAKGAEIPVVTMAGFFESTPPDVLVSVSDLWGRNPGESAKLHVPELSLYCTSEHCQREQRFKFTGGERYVPLSGWHYNFITFCCKNCSQTQKHYAIAVAGKDDHKGLAQKFGEIPPFGPHVPARVISLIGPDRALFLSGRRAENHGLGIGAFAYYRRVVENQKGRIIEQMAKVAGCPGVELFVLRQHFAASLIPTVPAHRQLHRRGCPAVRWFCEPWVFSA